MTALSHVPTVTLMEDLDAILLEPRGGSTNESISALTTRSLLTKRIR